MTRNTVLTEKILTIMRFNRDNATTVVMLPIATACPVPINTSVPTSSEKKDQITPKQKTDNNFKKQLNINSQKMIDVGQPKEAFVTYSNNRTSYLALLKVLLDSVHAFSTRPIIVFGIDVDLDIDVKQYPRVIKRRISQGDCGPVRSSLSQTSIRR